MLIAYEVDNARINAGVFGQPRAKLGVMLQDPDGKSPRSWLRCANALHQNRVNTVEERENRVVKWPYHGQTLPEVMQECAGHEISGRHATSNEIASQRQAMGAIGWIEAREERELRWK